MFLALIDHKRDVDGVFLFVDITLAHAHARVEEALLAVLGENALYRIGDLAVSKDVIFFQRNCLLYVSCRKLVEAQKADVFNTRAFLHVESKRHAVFDVFTLNSGVGERTFAKERFDVAV
jgi:hypothetical protein